MLVWVASYPRSGNTLTLLTLRDVLGIAQIGAVAKAKEGLDLGKIPSSVPPALDAVADWKPPPELGGLKGEELLDALRGAPETYFVKTHRLADADDPAPALYIVRDGRDALVSDAHFVEWRHTPQFQGLTYRERLRKLIEVGRVAFGSWSQNVSTWRRREAPLALLRYEVLTADPLAAVSDACDELGVRLPAPVRNPTSFAELHAIHPDAFRRGIEGSWKDEMPPRLLERFWHIHGEQMRALGYD